MKSVEEIANSIDWLIEYPNTFEWQTLFDSYIPWNMDSEENSAYADTYSGVLIAMPKWSARHLSLASGVVAAMGQKIIRFDDLCRALARLLMDDQLKDSTSVSVICLAVGKLHQKMKMAGIKELKPIQTAK